MHEKPSAPDGPQTPAGQDLEQLFNLAYAELRRLAATVRRGDAGATLNPTALVHEAWLKLAAHPPSIPVSRAHFMRLAARAMRQVLVEAARRRCALKRGNSAQMVTFDEAIASSLATAEDMLALEESLDELARLSARQAAIVECRFFGGLDVADTAAALGVAEVTVHRDWRVARAWLAARLRRPG